MAASAWTMPAVSDEQRGTVEALLRRRDLSPRQRERLEMVKAAALGHGLPEIARWSGRTVRTVRWWLGRFAEVGPAGLVDAPRPGRPVRADAAYLAALERAVETPPRELGLPFDVWTSPRLSEHLAATTGVRIAPGWLRALLARRDFVCGRPKHTLKHLQDAGEVAAAKAELAAAGGAGGRRAGPVRAAPRG
jgi:transposase